MVPVLTARQYDVLVLISRGLTFDAIGSELGIRADTAKEHAKHVRLRLGVPTSWQAVAAAYRQGILE